MHAADVSAVEFGDPAALALRIEVVGEIGDDLRADAFEWLAPAVFLRVEHGVARDHPAEIARPRLAAGRRRLSGLLSGSASSASTVRIARNQMLLLRRRTAGPSTAPTCRMVRVFERGERLAALGGHRQKALPCVVRRGLLADQPELVEAPQDAAEIAGVEIEVARDVGRGGAAALPDLVEHARLGERERAVEPAVLQHAEVLGIEAVEAPHRGDALRPAPWRPESAMAAASANYLTESSIWPAARPRTAVADCFGAAITRACQGCAPAATRGAGSALRPVSGKTPGSGCKTPSCPRATVRRCRPRNSAVAQFSLHHVRRRRCNAGTTARSRRAAVDAGALVRSRAGLRRAPTAQPATVSTSDPHSQPARRSGQGRRRIVGTKHRNLALCSMV